MHQNFWRCSGCPGVCSTLVSAFAWLILHFNDISQQDFLFYLAWANLGGWNGQTDSCQERLTLRTRETPRMTSTRTRPRYRSSPLDGARGPLSAQGELLRILANPWRVGGRASVPFLTLAILRSWTLFSLCHSEMMFFHFWPPSH